MWRAISPNLYKDIKLKFSGLSYLVYCNKLANYYQILIWVMSRLASLVMKWPMNDAIFLKVTHAKKILLHFFLQLLLLIQYLIRWHYKKGSYVTKIGFQSFFVKLLFYWCKILLCDFSKKVVHHWDRVSMFFGQLKVFSWVFMNDLTYDKVTYTTESVSNTTGF